MKPITRPVVLGQGTLSCLDPAVPAVVTLGVSGWWSSLPGDEAGDALTCGYVPVQLLGMLFAAEAGEYLASAVLVDPSAR